MADFQTQVEALTGLSIGSGVTTAQLTQFLTDGVIDVTHKCVSLRPDQISLFARESAEQTSNGLDLNGAKIVSVLREGGSNNDWRACRLVTPDVQSRVTDINSIHYASKYNPAYSVLDNGEINVFPSPGSNPDAFKVYYVNNVPLDKGGSALAYNHSDIKYFDDSKVYLVVLYASIRCLDHLVHVAQNGMPNDLVDIVLEHPSQSIPSLDLTTNYVMPIVSIGEVDFSDVESIATYTNPVLTLSDLPEIGDMTLPSPPTAPGITLNDGEITGNAPTYTPPTLTMATNISVSALSISVSVPAPPSLSDNSIDFSAGAPNYVPPILNLEMPTIPSDLSITAVAPTPPDLSDGTVGFNATPPGYTPPTVSPDFSDADDWIADEDSEMSRARVEVIQSKIQNYQQDIQNALNSFNKSNAEYQIEFQESFKDADLKGKLNSDLVGKFNTEVQKYVSQVNKEVQQYQANFNKEIESWKNRQNQTIQKYQGDIANNLNSFNALNAEYQVEFQRSLQNAQLASTDDVQKVTLYQSELQSYANQVNKEVQEYQQYQTFRVQAFQANRTTEVQKYQADIQNHLNSFNAKSTEYQAQLQMDIQNTQLKDTKQERDIKIYTQNLASYQAQVNSAVQEWQSQTFGKVFNEWKEKENQKIQKYQVDVQKETSRVAASAKNFELNMTKALQEYQAETGNDLTKFQNDLAKNSGEFQNNLAAYQADFQKIAANNQSKVTKYASEVQNYANIVGKVKMDVDLYHQRSMKLEKQYNEAFMIMAPRQQQGEK